MKAGWLAVAVTGLVAGVGGTILGYVVGVESQWFVDSGPRGAISLARLNALDAGKVDSVRIQLEYELDDSLVMYSRVNDFWWTPLYDAGLLMRSRDQDEEYIRRLASYRKVHPSPYSQYLAKESPDDSELIQDHVRRIEVMVEKYGD